MPSDSHGSYRQMTATAYCGQFGSGSINGNGVTSGGTNLKDGKQHYVIAAGPGSGLSIGDKVVVSPNPFNDLVVWQVDDHGGMIVGNHIDLYVADCAKAKQWGRKSVKVYKMASDTPVGSPTVKAPNQIAPGVNIPNPADVANGVADALSRIEKLLESLFNGSTWFRIGKVLVGVFIGVYGFIILSRPAVNALPPSIKTAAKAAAVA